MYNGRPPSAGIHIQVRMNECWRRWWIIIDDANGGDDYQNDDDGDGDDDDDYDDGDDDDDDGDDANGGDDDDDDDCDRDERVDKKGESLSPPQGGRVPGVKKKKASKRSQKWEKKRLECPSCQISPHHIYKISACCGEIKKRKNYILWLLKLFCHIFHTSCRTHGTYYY